MRSLRDAHDVKMRSTLHKAVKEITRQNLNLIIRIEHAMITVGYTERVMFPDCYQLILSEF